MSKLLLIVSCVFLLSCRLPADSQVPPGMPPGTQVPPGYRIPKQGDATVEVLSPKSKEIFKPGSNIEVETRTEMHGRTLKDIYVTYDGIGQALELGPTPMELVSVEGDVYRHHLTLENAPLGRVYSNLMVYVIDDSDAVTTMDVGYLVKERPQVRINSVKDGQTFVKPDRIAVSIDKAAIGRSNEDQFCLVVDGRDQGVYPDGALFWLSPRPGTHTIQIVVRFTDIELSRSELITVHVK